RRPRAGRAPPRAGGGGRPAGPLPAAGRSAHRRQGGPARRRPRRRAVLEPMSERGLEGAPPAAGAPGARTVLVTGAAGFIGFHLARRLLERGDVVVGVDNLNDYYDVSLKEARLGLLLRHPAFSFHRVDLADEAALTSVFAAARPAVVVNLAAQAGVRYS